jgi:hypothetical protein
VPWGTIFSVKSHLAWQSVRDVDLQDFFLTSAWGYGDIYGYNDNIYIYTPYFTAMIDDDCKAET